MQDRPHALVAGLVLNTTNDGDGGTAASLAEDHSRGRSHKIDQGLLLTLGSPARIDMFRGPERGDPGSSDRDHGRAETIRPAVRVGYDYRYLDSCRSSDRIAQSPRRGIRIRRKQPHPINSVSIHTRGRQLIAKPMPGNDGSSLSGHEVLIRFIQNDLDNLGRLTCPSGQLHGRLPRGDPG